jgi:hypothetical protein
MLNKLRERLAFQLFIWATKASSRTVVGCVCVILDIARETDPKYDEHDEEDAHGDVPNVPEEMKDDN